VEQAARASWHQAATHMQEEILHLSVELRYKDQAQARDSTKLLDLARHAAGASAGKGSALEGVGSPSAPSASQIPPPHPWSPRFELYDQVRAVRAGGRGAEEALKTTRGTGIPVYRPGVSDKSSGAEDGGGRCCLAPSPMSLPASLD
jgi:hypothetical protein